MNNLKLKGILTVLAGTLLLTGCVVTPPDTRDPIDTESYGTKDPVKPDTEDENETENNSVINPWTDSSKEEEEGILGISLNIPEEAKDVVYRVNDSLCEVQFNYENMDYTYRLQKTSSLTDISGCYYEWTSSSENLVKGLNATAYRSISEEEMIDLIIWYDETSGITHSLCTSGKDLSGFDIIATAEKLMTPSGSAQELNSQTDYFEIYKPVLDEIYNAIKSGVDFEGEGDNLSVGIMERIAYGEEFELLNSIGYKIEDISGDGIPELIIGENRIFGDPESGEVHNTVYSVFSCKDGNLVFPIEGWARNSFCYLGDGKFIYSGSGGAMYSMFGVCRLSSDGSEKVWEDYYFTYDKNEGTEIGYYHNTTGEWDTAVSEELEITGEEFWNMYDAYTIDKMEWDDMIAGLEK